MYKEKTVHKVRLFYEKDEEDFQILMLRAKTALRGRELIEAIIGKAVETKTNERPST